MTPKRIMRLPVLILGVFLLSVPLGALGQSKTDKLINKANSYFSSYNVIGAEELYKEVLAQDENNFEAAYQLGRVNNYLKDYREALRWFRKASEIDPDRNDTVYLHIGLAYKRLNNYRKARESFEEFKTRHQTRDEYYERAELEIKGCDIAEASLNGRPNFRVKPVSFNSTASDRFPSYLDQRQEDVFLSFASARPLPRKKNKRNQVTGEPKDSDIYYIVKENDSTFGADVMRFPYHKKKGINTKGNDGPASFTNDGLTMFFTICNSKFNKDGCSIFESRYNPIKKEWGPARVVEGIVGKKEIIVNSRGKTKTVPTDDRQPFITPDGRTLLFVSDRGGGQGGFDIWYSRRLGSGWSEPQNLGEAINTPFNEASPFVNKENTMLYFASEGLGGFGGYDLYYSEGTIGSFEEPVNLGAPLNSTYNDFGSYWMDDSLVYFTSDRPGGMGSYDIYWGRAIYYPEPNYEISVKGLIRDKETKQPIPFATATLFEYQEDGSIAELGTFNTDQSARYEFKELEKERKYKILGNAPEYLANEEEVSTEGINTDKELVVNIDIELEPIVLDSAIVLQNIYYDFDEYYLRPDALDELEFLIKILNDNPNIMIQMGSHTDSNGTEPYNKDLSNNRARAVVRYLADNGINPDRLTWFGFGESDPLIYPELSDEDEQANRRTEFRITSIEFD